MQRKKDHGDRPNMTKRKSENAAKDDRTAVMSAKIKMETQSTDYSEDVKKKLSTASRTSTACDRCRVRKMRCDDQPEGCNPCRQNQTECKTTDRITGKATVRGYVESLERRVQEHEAYIRQLQARVQSLGGDISPDDGVGDPPDASSLQWPGADSVARTSDSAPADLGSTQEDGCPVSGKSYSVAGAMEGGLPKFRSGLTGNNYLGVSTGDSLLSSIRGTSMNVLGIEIDIADYRSPDLDEPSPSSMMGPPVYNKSYRAFIQTAFGASPRLTKVELPPRQAGLEQATVFFQGIHPFLPILHGPTFMKTLARFYDDPTFQPTIAETVKVHAIFAIIHCQIATRAPQSDEHRSELNQSSNFHYHYALSFFSQLMASHTLDDVQALALLGMHVRNLPKPGACWMLISITLNLAIELGFHRSAKSWAATSKRPNPLELELRKRVFWAIVVLHVTVSGNLGRPLALRSEDWDVEMPEAVDDDLLSDNGIDRSRSGKCNFLVGLEGMRLMPVMTDLYNSIYTVKRSPHTYVDTVRGLERRIKEWTEQWPREILESSANENDPYHVHAQWLEIAPLHLRLLLRHPSLSLTSNTTFNAENLTVCLEVSRKMLHHVKQLQKFHCLDGTWQSGALYVLAISTTLFAHWERRDSVTSKSLDTLKDDMAAWLGIIGELGQLLGSGQMLQNAVQISIEKTLKALLHHLALKDPPPPPIHSLPLSQSTTSKSSASSIPNSAIPVYGQSGYYASYPGSEQVTSPNSDVQMTEPQGFMPQAGVNNQNSQMSYHDPQAFAYPSTYPASPTTYEQRPFAQSNGVPNSSAAAQAYMNPYSEASHAYTMVTAYSSNPNYQQHSAGSPSAWRDFTGTITSNVDPGTADYISPASALMQMGRSDGAAPQQGMHMGLEMPQNGNTMNGNEGQGWPFGHY